MELNFAERERGGQFSRMWVRKAWGPVPPVWFAGSVGLVGWVPSLVLPGPLCSRRKQTAGIFPA